MVGGLLLRPIRPKPRAGIWGPLWPKERVGVDAGILGCMMICCLRSLNVGLQISKYSNDKIASIVWRGRRNDIEE